MQISLGSRIKRAWNVFIDGADRQGYHDYGYGYYSRPDRVRLSRGNERSIVTSVYNRIAMDAASVDVKHVRLDENGRYLETIDSGLNNCLSLEANLDQTGRAFIQDAVLSMLDEGCVALVPIDTDSDPDVTGSFKIETIRTGKILDWYPAHIRVEIYNDQTGRKEQIVVAKDIVSIVENPLYAVMNEPNSTMQRLIRKLNLLDAVDEQSSSGKLDLIIQLPYVIKTDARRKQAEDRRAEIERQLSGSKYGIAYTDGTEHITQLNRPVENNLMKQIEYLTSMLYSQLGITQSVLDGTADEQTMLNYNNRTIEPILSAITDEMRRKFLTKTARSQKQSVEFFRDPFRLVPVSDLAEISDKMTRNEIMTSNEIRQIIGMKPSDDPKADELRNSNISAPKEESTNSNNQIVDNSSNEMTKEEYDNATALLDELDSQIDSVEAELNDSDNELKHYASEYYDPQKAHEYYMRTRELKGRRSTRGLNDEGKAAAKYVKEQLTSERKSLVQDHKDQTNDEIEDLRDAKNYDIEVHKHAMQSKIDQLRELLKSMDKDQKRRQKDRIYGVIDDLREQNKQERARLNEEFKQSSQSLRSDHRDKKTELKLEYDEKYVEELDKIRSEAKFQRVSKKKSRR